MREGISVELSEYWMDAMDPNSELSEEDFLEILKFDNEKGKVVLDALKNEFRDAYSYELVSDFW